MAILTCPFEPPKLGSLDSAEDCILLGVYMVYYVRYVLHG